MAIWILWWVASVFIKKREWEAISISGLNRKVDTSVDGYILGWLGAIFIPLQNQTNTCPFFIGLQFDITSEFILCHVSLLFPCHADKLCCFYVMAQDCSWVVYSSGTSSITPCLQFNCLLSFCNCTPLYCHFILVSQINCYTQNSLTLRLLIAEIYQKILSE